MNRSLLWKNDSFINHNIPFLFNRIIIEYDMKDAGFSLSKEFKLLDNETITKLEKYKKEKRTIELGLLQKKNPEYTKKLKECFREARRLFFEENNLQDEDIISVKKDAIFTTKHCDTNMFGDNILFREKNIYSSYIQLEKLEFYYSMSKLDIKGMSEENIKYHEEYMIKFIKNFFRKMETTDATSVINFTKRFIDKYKRYDLEVGYYRSFDFKSNYTLINDDTEFMDYWEEDKRDLNITYNYFNILLKLIQIPL